MHVVRQAMCENCPKIWIFIDNIFTSHARIHVQSINWALRAAPTHNLGAGINVIILFVLVFCLPALIGRGKKLSGDDFDWHLNPVTTFYSWSSFCLTNHSNCLPSIWYHLPPRKPPCYFFYYYNFSTFTWHSSHDGCVIWTNIFVSYCLIGGGFFLLFSDLT